MALPDPPRPEARAFARSIFALRLGRLMMGWVEVELMVLPDKVGAVKV